MAGDNDNVRVWVDADAYVGPLDATPPTDVTTALDSDFDALGLLSEDGMTESRDQEQTDHHKWNGGLVRTTRSKHKRMIKVTALEDNPVVFGLVNPGSSANTVGDVTTRTVKTPTPNPQQFVLETVDGDITRRRVIPRGEVLEVADVLASPTEMQMYELTITIYPTDDDVIYYDISDDPQYEEAGS